LSDVLRPAAKITAVTPNTIAASVTRVRAGCANGPARPMVTGLGSRRALPSSRCAPYPWAGRGARPDAIACTALIRPARSAIANAVTPTRPSIASGTVRLTQSGTARLPTPKTCAAWPSIGTATRLPVVTPAAQPMAAGTATWST
jgi:hypothetical protein